MFVPHLKRYITREQFNELKDEINKTEYEKAREPLEKTIQERDHKIFDLERELDIYRDVITEIVNSIEQDYIQFYVQTNPIKVQYGKDIEITQPDNFQEVAIPIKYEFKNAIIRKILDKKEKINNENIQI